MTKAKTKSPQSKAINYSLLFLLYLVVFSAITYVLSKLLPVDLLLLNEIGVILSAVASVATANKVTGDTLKDSIDFGRYDIIIVLTAIVLTFSGGEVLDNIVGHLLSGFMKVKENNDIPFNIIGCLSSVVLAPIFEELIFRYSMRSVLKKHCTIKFMVLFTSAIFALVHGYNIQGFLNVFVQAVFLMIIYHYTNNLLITISIHSVHNALCYLPIENFAYRNVNGFVLSTPLWFGISAVLTFIALAVFFRYFVPEYIKTDISEQKSENKK